MRFKTKFDRWIVLVLVITAALTCVVLPRIRLLVPGSQPVPLPAVFMPFAIWLIVLPNTLPQLLPYSSIVEVQPTTDTRSAAVFSADRIFVMTQIGKRFILAVVEEERSLEELARRCPQQDRKPL